MINSNHHYLTTFLLRDDIQKIVSASTKLCPAEELGLEYSRELNKENSTNFEFIMNINPKVLKVLSPEEKVFLYTILRIFSLTENAEWKFLFNDYNNLLKSRTFDNERYFYLESLNNDFFSYEIDCILTEKYQSRRFFFRRLKSKFVKNTLTLEDILFKYFTIRLIKKTKRKNKRLERHKGYRDHGSLGTGDRKLDEDIYSDIWIAEKERLRRKERTDLIDFLHGLGGLH